MLSTSLRTLSHRVPLLRSAPSLAFRTGSKNLHTSTRRHAEVKTKAPDAVDAFMNGGNAYYADEMYKQWREVSRCLDGGRSSEALHQMGVAVAVGPSFRP